MKKLHFIKLLFVSLLLFTCSDNDTKSEAPTIVRAWNVVDVDVNGTGEMSSFGQPISVDVVGETDDISYKITFTESPNNAATAGGYGMTFTATASGGGGTYTETYSDYFDFFENGTWTESDNQLTVTSSSGTQVYEIINLTSNTVSLKTTVQRDIVISGNTVAVTADVTYSLVY